MSFFCSRILPVRVPHCISLPFSPGLWQFFNLSLSFRNLSWQTLPDILQNIPYSGSVVFLVLTLEVGVFRKTATEVKCPFHRVACGVLDIHVTSLVMFTFFLPSKVTIFPFHTLLFRRSSLSLAYPGGRGGPDWELSFCRVGNLYILSRIPYERFVSSPFISVWTHSCLF